MWRFWGEHGETFGSVVLRVKAGSSYLVCRQNKRLQEQLVRVESYSWVFKYRHFVVIGQVGHQPKVSVFDNWESDSTTNCYTLHLFKVNSFLHNLEGRVSQTPPLPAVWFAELPNHQRIYNEKFDGRNYYMWDWNKSFKWIFYSILPLFLVTVSGDIPAVQPVFKFYKLSE